jgi:hypothetical protein
MTTMTMIIFPMGPFCTSQVVAAYNPEASDTRMVECL